MKLGILPSSKSLFANRFLCKIDASKNMAAVIMFAIAFLFGSIDLSAQCSISPTGGSNVSQDFTTSNVGSCVDLTDDNLEAVGITAGVESSPPDSCFIYWRNPDVAGTGLDTLIPTDSVIVCCDVTAPQSDANGNLLLPPGTYSLFSDDDGIFDGNTANDSVVYTINLIDNGSPSIDSCAMDTTIAAAGDSCSADYNIPNPIVDDNCSLDSISYTFSAGTPAPDALPDPYDASDWGFDLTWSDATAISNATASPAADWQIFDGEGLLTVEGENGSTEIGFVYRPGVDVADITMDVKVNLDAGEPFDDPNNGFSGDAGQQRDHILIARASSNAKSGYALQVDYEQPGDAVVLNLLAYDDYGASLTFLNTNTIGGTDVETYRVEFILDGTSLTGNLYNESGMTLLGSVMTTDMTYTSGTYGLAGASDGSSGAPTGVRSTFDSLFVDGQLVESFPQVERTFYGSASSCEATTVVTQKFFDESGNVDSCTFNVTVVDTTNPVWDDGTAQMMSYPDDPGENYTTMYDAMGGVSGGPSVTVMTDDTCISDAFGDWDAWLPVAEDNCDTTVVTQVFDSITYNFDSVDQGPPCVVYERIQYFEAMDICDSTTIDSFTLIFQIKDTQGPEFADTTVSDTTLFTSDFDSTLCGVDVCETTGPFGSVIAVSADDCIPLADSNYTFEIEAAEASDTAQLDSTSGVGADACQFFPPGDFTITYTATDQCGLSSTTSIALTIVDDSPPMLTGCPGDIVDSTAADVCYQTVSWTPPVPEDNCEIGSFEAQAFDKDGESLTVISANQPGCQDVGGFEGPFSHSNWTESANGGTGSAEPAGPDSNLLFLNSGTEGVQYDINTTSDGFVTVGFENADTTLSSVTFNSSALPGGSYTFFMFPTSSASYTVPVEEGGTFGFELIDNTSPPIFNEDSTLIIITSFTFNCAGADYLVAPQGENTVIYTAEDAEGNVDSCTFNVTIEDDQSPEIIACAGDQFFPSICDSTEIPDYRGQIAYNENCNCDTILQMPAPGTTLAEALGSQGDTLPEHGDELDFTFVVEDCEGNADTCMNTVTLQDNDGPVPTEVPLDATIDMDDILAAGCGEVTLPAPTAVDCNGCIIYGTTSAGSNVIYHPGVPNPNGCGPALVPPTYTFFVDPGDSVAQFAITWIYNDGNNTSTQTQQITVMNDFEDPIVECPADVTIGTGEDGDSDCTVVPNEAGDSIDIEFTAPELPYPPGGVEGGEYTDNCDNDPTVEYEISGATTVLRTIGNDAGTETFNVGMNTVTYYVTDASGNSATCSFTVEVEDDQAPMVECPPQEVTLFTGDEGDATAGDCAYTVSSDQYDPMNVTDNCGVDSISYNVSMMMGVEVDPDKGTTLNGTTFDISGDSNSESSAIITWTISDTSGNTTTCVTEFTIIDGEDPLAVCPEDTTVGISEDGDSTDCVYTVQGAEFDPDTSDNCMVAFVQVDVPEDVTTNNPEETNFETLDGAEFPIGTTVVTWTVEDKAGNTSTCTVEVTVADDVEPVFTYCPAGDDPRFTNDTITLPNITGECFSSVLWERPDINDIEDCPEGPGNADVTITEDISDPSVQAQVDANFPYDQDAINDTAYAQFPVGVTEVAYTATDAAGNTSTCVFFVNIIDTMPPTVVSCVGNQEQPSNCPEARIPNYTTLGVYADNCEANDEQLTITQSPAPQTTLGDIFGTMDSIPDGSTYDVTITVSDEAGNTATCTFEVEINEGDNGEPPVPTIAGPTLPQDSTDCGSLIVDAPTADDCGETFFGIPNQGQYINDSTYEFTTGTYFVIWTYIDDENNTSAQSQLIIVEDDTIGPTITCEDVTVTLDENGEGSIEVDDVLASASDNCTESMNLTTSLSDSTFDCGDATGASSPSMIISAIYDGDLSGGTPKGVGLYVINDISDLSAYGVGSANNGGPSFGEEFEFPAISASAGDYIYLVDDGNSSEFNTYFGFSPDYEDNMGFSAASINGDDVVELFEEGTVIDRYGVLGTDGTGEPWEYADGWAYRNSGSSPNEGTFSESNWVIENGAFDGASDNSEATPPMPIGTFFTPSTSTGGGPVPVVLTVTDEFGNATSCEVDVTVVDDTDPVAECQDTTIELDENGTASISPEDLDAGSTDNCSIESFATSDTTFDCSNEGENTVVLTVTDPSGNTSTCTATVTVEDNTAPTVQCQDITVSLGGEEVTVDAQEVDAGSTDNCGIESYELSEDMFTCDDVGDNEVVLTVTDVNGNTASCEATVTIADNTAPTVICDPDIETCVAQQEVEVFNFDACGVESVTFDITGATDTSGGGDEVDLKFNPGVSTVLFTVTDVNGNTNTCTTEVNVTDSLAPTPVCIDDINTTIGSDGDVTIPAEVFDGGSFDNGCTPAEPLDFQIEVNGGDPVDAFTFDCTDLGENDVKLVVTDAACNTATCWTSITIQDHVDPTAVCISDTFELVVNNNPTPLSPLNIDDGSFDNNSCDPITLDVMPSEFEMSDAGFNTVTLTVTDPSGNTATCTATVEVIDGTPEAVCEDITVNLDSDGEADIEGEDVDGGSSDDTEIADYSVTPSMFDCSDIGDNPVTLTVTDNDGNTSTCTATVTVEDNEAPTALCEDVTVDLNSDGDATITANLIDGGSTDNCGVASISISQESFDCGDVGSNVVVLTVTDVNGNTSTCSSAVTIRDVTSPFFVCDDESTLVLNSEGEGTLAVGDIIDTTLSDACGIGPTELSQSSFDCGDLGPNDVTLTVTDVNGNTATCETTVNVEAPQGACPAVTFVAGDVGGDQNTMVQIPITVHNFDSIVGFQYSVHIDDNTVATVDSVIDGSLDVTESISGNDIGISWVDATGNGVSLPEGDTIMWIKVTLIGEVGDVSPVTFDSMPTSIEVTQLVNGTPETVEHMTSDGEVSVDGASPTVSLSGSILEEDSTAVEDVTVDISGGFSGSAVTDGSGDYSEMVPTGSDITVTPGKDIDYSEGVTTFDILLIQAHILTADTLDSPYKLIAADANASQTISTFDLVQLQALVVGNITELPSNTSWRFVDENYTFPDPTDPWAEDFPEWLNLNMATAVSDADFIGVKIGDVIDAGTLQGGGTIEDRATIFFESTDRAVRAGQAVELEVRADNFDALRGYQSTLEFEESELNYVGTRVAPTLEGLSEKNFGERYLEDGQLVFNWYNTRGQSVEDGEVLFTVVFEANTDIESLREKISVSDDVLRSEAYTQSEVMNLGLTFRERSATTEQVFALYQNEPNPFAGQTTIGFVLPRSAEATLKIFNATGKLIEEIEGEYQKGYNEQVVELEGAMEGVFYYQLSTDEHSAAKQMILTE